VPALTEEEGGRGGIVEKNAKLSLKKILVKLAAFFGRGRGETLIKGKRRGESQLILLGKSHWRPRTGLRKRERIARNGGADRGIDEMNLQVWAVATRNSPREKPSSFIKKRTDLLSQKEGKCPLYS